jgi:hypothetical protein
MFQRVVTAPLGLLFPIEPAAPHATFASGWLQAHLVLF